MELTPGEEWSTWPLSVYSLTRGGSTLRGFLISTGERPISDDRHQCKGPRIVSYPVSYRVSPIAQEADKEENEGAVCHVVIVHCPLLQAGSSWAS